MVSTTPATGNGAGGLLGKALVMKATVGETLVGKALVGCFLTLALVGPVGAQQETTEAPTFADAGARELLSRARAAREVGVEGIDSYEGVIRERLYVGVTAWRFRRERGLVEQERVARIRWSADGHRAIHWLAMRRAVPIIGADTRPEGSLEEEVLEGVSGEATADLRAEIVDELLGEVDLPAFTFDPGGDRLGFGDEWALDPLSDTADAHYRFSSGDTLTLRLPSEQRDIVLIEVRVEPKRSDYRLVAGSLWFDRDGASLVRATYKPARPFNFAEDLEDEDEDVPGFLKPVEAELSYITVEYSLQEFQYWLPRRFALEGEARLGGLLTIPMTLEWNVRDYRVNEAESDIPLDEPLPEGWSRQEQETEDEDGNTEQVTVIVPTLDSLLTSPLLTEAEGERSPTAFSDDEIGELVGELEALLPTGSRFRPRFAWGLQEGMLRFNRVEGLSIGASTTLPVSASTAVWGEARIGTSDREPNMSLGLRRGPDSRQWTLTGYHRLEGMPNAGDPFSFTSSASALVLGTDRGEFVRSTGVALGHVRAGERVRFEAEAYWERQRPAALETDFFLLSPVRDDSVSAVLAADSVDIGGVRATLAWFSGIDPDGLILTGRLAGEVAGGDAAFRSASASLSASHPLPLGLAGAIEVAGGAAWGDVPIQHHFFLGGSGSLRGYNGNGHHGSAFWRGRAELASGFAGARIGVFTDVGSVGAREGLAFDDPFVALGIGTSLLDGLIRFDVARAVRREVRWKVHVYLDGLF